MPNEPLDPHADVEKHLQLGVDPESPGDTSRDFLTSKSDQDLLWSDASTVEEFKEDIESLRDAGWPTDGA